MPSDTIEQRTRKLPFEIEIPSDIDIANLLIWEEERRKEQQRRQDEAYLRLPVPEMPYRRPEPEKRDPERGVVIIPLY